MDEERSASQVSWGAWINTRVRLDAQGDTAGVRPVDSDQWTEEGHDILRRETQHTIRLTILWRYVI